jgi:endonuclease/exonuclease/phosphatase family metal-dependent hydrolase
MDFTVAAFNAHWGCGRRGVERGVRFDVVGLIRSWDADIVVLPESWRDDDGHGMVDELADDGYTVESLAMMPLAARGDRSGAHDAMPRRGMWELTVCTRFEVKARQEMPLGYLRVDPVRRRPALSLTVDIDGTAVEVVGLHTSSFLFTFAPLRHLYNLKRQLRDDGPQIVAGDFNFWGPPVALMMRGWERPVRGRTWPAHRPHSQIDHVLVRNGIVPLSGEVLAETPSDHRPIRARLRLLP